MHVILLRQLGQRLLALNAGLWFRRGRCSSCLLLAASMAAVRPAIHLYSLFRFFEQPLIRQVPHGLAD